MRKEDYLKRLKYLLMDMPMEDLKQIEDFYEELILDGLDQGYTEEEFLGKLESPEVVADKIRAEYGGMVVYTAKAKSREKKRDYESTELIHTVRIETENLKIRVKTTEDGPVRVYFKKKDDLDEVLFEEKDGVFSFIHKRKENVLLKNLLSLFVDFNLLILELPMNFAGNLYLQTTNGAIRISGLGSLVKGEISSNNGRIKMENGRAENLQIKTNNGKIDLVNLMGETIDVSTGNGLINVKECRYTEQLSLQTQNGAVTAKNIISDHISMKTSNGLVTALIIGNENDYNINSTTRNGFNNLENIYEPERTKSLVARTHNGRIQVDFTL